MKEVMGIDVGATGMKAAIVDTKTGQLVSERIKYMTPKPATPEAMLGVIKKLIDDLNWKEKPIGIGFPAIIKDGICLSASNIDDSWLDFPIVGFLNKKLKSPVNVVNDADAAGIAEINFGTVKSDLSGQTILITLGTGIGSAIFWNGTLIPNTELGHLKYRESVLEDYASNRVREEKDMSWKAWGKDLNKVLKHVNFVLSPDRILLGGGVSKKFDKYSEFINADVSVQPATLLNFAGIIGAAMAAPSTNKEKS